MTLGGFIFRNLPVLDFIKHAYSVWRSQQPPSRPLLTYLMLVRSDEVQVFIWLVEDRESQLQHLLQRGWGRKQMRMNGGEVVQKQLRSRRQKWNMRGRRENEIVGGSRSTNLPMGEFRRAVEKLCDMISSIPANVTDQSEKIWCQTLKKCCRKKISSLFLAFKWVKEFDIQSAS